MENENVLETIVFKLVRGIELTREDDEVVEEVVNNRLNERYS